MSGCSCFLLTVRFGKHQRSIWPAMAPKQTKDGVGHRSAQEDRRKDRERDPREIESRWVQSRKDFAAPYGNTPCPWTGGGGAEGSPRTETSCAWAKRPAATRGSRGWVTSNNPCIYIKFVCRFAGQRVSRVVTCREFHRAASEKHQYCFRACKVPVLLRRPAAALVPAAAEAKTRFSVSSQEKHF